MYQLISSYSSHSDSYSDDSEMAANVKKEDTYLLVGRSNNGQMGTDVEKPKYPKCVLLIIGNEFCERFSYYGMRAILVIYMIDWLHFSDNQATFAYHAFVMLCYFTPLLGATLADGFLGKYKAILILSLIYAVGNIIMSLTAFPPPNIAGPAIGLVLIGFGTGGIKPCVSAFGGDQFASNQEKEQKQFFSLFYFTVNLGAFFSMIITPLLRVNVRCFQTNCFSVAFGVPAILMLLAIGLFVLGRNHYKIIPPKENAIGRLYMAVGRALRKKVCEPKDPDKDHWLDYANDKYEQSFLDGVKVVLRVLVLYIPLPMFWALFDQQGSRWTLQALQLNGHVVGNWYMLPDQMPVFNAVLILVFIPLTDYIIYPIFAKCGLLTKTLHRMVVGMFLAAVAFVLAGVLQLQMESAGNVSKIAPNIANILVMNALPCTVTVDGSFTNSSMYAPQQIKEYHAAAASYPIKFTTTDSCQVTSVRKVEQVTLTFTGGQGCLVIVADQYGSLTAKNFSFNTGKAQSGAHLSIIYTPELDGQNITIILRNIDKSDESYEFRYTQDFTSASSDVYPARYKVALHSVNTTTLLEQPDLQIQSGAVYVCVVTDTGSKRLQMVTHEVVTPSSISIFWQVPQYVVLTMGEIFFSISGLEFSYSQAPPDLKSVVQAMWLMTVAFGNLIDVFVAGIIHLPSQSSEFFFFAGLMIVCMMIFAILGYFYHYRTPAVIESSLNSDDKTLVDDTSFAEQSTEKDDGKSGYSSESSTPYVTAAESS